MPKKTKNEGNHYFSLVEYREDQDVPRHQITTEYQGETALRLLLGTNASGKDIPNLFIERHPDHWRIFIHANDGDPQFCVYIYKTEIVVEDEETSKKLTAEVPTIT